MILVNFHAPTRIKGITTCMFQRVLGKNEWGFSHVSALDTDTKLYHQMWSGGWDIEYEDNFNPADLYIIVRVRLNLTTVGAPVNKRYHPTRNNCTQTLCEALSLPRLFWPSDLYRYLCMNPQI